MPFTALGIGAVAGLAGGALGASAASRTKRQLEGVANTPGLDVKEIGREGIDAYLANLERGGEASMRTGRLDQQALNAMLEEGAPGFREGQEARIRNATALARGELPKDVEDLINRRAAAKSFAGGYAGTGAGRNLTLRDLGRTSLDAIGAGSSMLSNISQSTPLARLRSSAEFLGPTGGDLANLRAKEREQKMLYKTLAAQSPGATAVWGSALQNLGGGLMGASGSLPSGGIGPFK